MGPAAVILAFAATTGLNGETPCQQCCAPGGDCSKAFKGTPGKCCGTLNGQAFCCPGISYRGAASGDAKCYNCGGEAYRCYTGTSSRNICGGSPQRHPHEWTRSAPSHRLEQYSRHDDSSATGAMLLLGVAIVVGVLFCFRRQHDHVEMYHASPYAPVGTPVPGKPMYGQQMAYGAQPMAYAQPMYGPPMHGGCGGGNAAPHSAHYDPPLHPSDSRHTGHPLASFYIPPNTRSQPPGPMHRRLQRHGGRGQRRRRIYGRDDAE
jgi:hypothetical protein